jgi:DNA sulfur modification protein DndD
MILRSITLNNYGLFRGEHKIDLTTRPGKPIVLFGGKNGAGKTTFLDALQLCIYGSIGLGERLSKDEYAALLAQRIHSSPALLVQPSFASVSLAFDFADMGRLKRYEVRRSWERSPGGRVLERLQVSIDGEEQSDFTAEQWGDFVRELVPPGVSRLFFFDGEKIQHLAEESSDQRELGISVKALIGTDLIERLQADLSIYRTRLGKTDRRPGDSEDFSKVSQLLAECEVRVGAIDAQRNQTELELTEIRTQIGLAEQRLAAEGGAFSKNRDSIVTRREEARATIATLEQSIGQLAQGTLPFTLSRDLCLQVRGGIQQEEEFQRIAAGQVLLERAKTRVLKDLESLSWLPEGGGISKTQARLVNAQIRGVLEKAHASVAKIPRKGRIPEQAPIHQLSANESRQLLQWIDQALQDTPDRLRELSTELESAYRSLQKTEEALKRIPADDVLAPLLSNLQELNQRYGALSEKALRESEALRIEGTRLSDLRRKLSGEADKLNQNATDATKVRMISKAQAVLDEFRDTLLSRKIRELEASVTTCFNLLSRKTDAVKRVAINSKDFTVTLFDREGVPLPKNRLSAGEKQIYAIAMLWALARTSGRPLPVIIDTPLGRLDSDHRRLLVERYFPHASHQVIILSTDTEVDTVYFDALRPFVANAYRLEYDMAERSTNVRSGYFFGERNEAD